MYRLEYFVILSRTENKTKESWVCTGWNAARSCY